MKNGIVWACLMAFLVFAPAGVAGGQERQEALQQIKKWYRAIESDKRLVKQEIQAVSDLPYEPKLVRYTSPSGELKKLEISLQSDHGLVQETYYFEKGALFFIYAVDEYWQFAPGSDPEKPETVDVGSQQRYYFQRGKCIQALEKQVETKDGDKLRELLAKADNKALEVGLAAEAYVRKAELVSQIKTVQELQRFIETATRGGQ